MEEKNGNANEKKNPGSGHSHLKHMKMMVICCGLPIVGFLLIGVLGIRSPSFETMLFLICPLGMGFMMFKMMRGEKKGEGRSCCDPNREEVDQQKPPQIPEEDKIT